MRPVRTLTLIICSLFIAANAYIYQQYIFMLAFLILALATTGIWIYKFQRDLRIITQAKEARLTTTNSKPPLKTSPDSRRLFVPPPIN